MWIGTVRSTLDPGGSYSSETDTASRYVAICTKSGALVHEGTLYKTLADIGKAGIRAPFVPGAEEDGF